ncbi:unnamed protein product [Ixodes pacificus]
MRQAPPPISYGISLNARLLLLAGALLFVLGGTFAVTGVAMDDELKWCAGVGIMVLGVTVYTLIIMFAEVTGPPSGTDLSELKTVLKVKPASFHPNRGSRMVLFLAGVLFSSGSTMVVSGFKLSMPYLWIPGYSMSVIAFVVYTAVVLYGPLTITPGAIIVAFPHDTPPKPETSQVSARLKEETWNKSGLDDYRGFLGFQKYANRPRGCTPQNP